ncbi:hypothetical protein [Robiginitalea sediminis]|uniref:hypothetical protein n=1 Tax=Robiginitalea sediminis TaxID=1982593 RepID=UPI000B4BE5F7|nr:hypothetical protein [Robiginitalea sediminis]
MAQYCLECKKKVADGFAAFSIAQFGVPLCLKHQRWLLVVENRYDPAYLRLYFELHDRDIGSQIQRVPGSHEIEIFIQDPPTRVHLDTAIQYPVVREAFNITRRDYFSHLNEPDYPVVLAHSLMESPEHTRNTVDFLIVLLGINAELSHGRDVRYTYRSVEERIDYRSLTVYSEVVTPEPDPEPTNP